MPYEKLGNNEPVCIADEVPFEIPESWEWVRLGGLVFNRGQMTPSADFCYIDIGSIDNKKQQLSKEENIISAEKAPSRARKIVAQGDILYSTVRPYLHNMCIIDKEFSHQPIASTGFAALVCHKGYYNEFLFYYLMSPDFDAYANDTDNARGVAYPAINDAKLYQALIPVPPYSEQIQIVTKIRELLPYIERYSITYAEADAMNSSFPEKLKKSILQEAVQGKLVSQDPNDEPASMLLERIRAEKQALIKAGKIKKDKNESVIFRRDNSHYEKLNGIERCIDDEIPFEIPENWCWVHLSDIMNVVSARRVHQSDWKTSGVPFYRAREVGKLCEQGYVDNELYISEELFELFSQNGVPSVNDIMVTAVGTLGKTYVVKETDRFYYKDASVICFENFGKINPYYIQLVMASPYMTTQIKEHSSGTTVGTITISTASNYYVPVPPLAEQQRIVSTYNSLVPHIEQL